jgi:hypothetical protein
MIHQNEIRFEDVVQGDPTLKYLMRDAVLDFDNLEHQVNLRANAVLIAINRWLDLKYS